MKKSSTMSGNLSQWSRKLSTSWTSFNSRVRKKSPTKLSTAELIKNYELEEDEFLRELENLQQRTNNNVVGVGGVSSLMQQRRTSRSTSEASSIASSICVSPQSDLLGSFCHLMNYVVHLRRENRHLRKQVLCLQEMRKIEQLQNELLRAACTCCGESAFGGDATGCTKGLPTSSDRHESTTPTVVIGGRSSMDETGSCKFATQKLLHSSSATCESAPAVGRTVSVPTVLDEKYVVPGRKGTPSLSESRTPEDPISSATSLEIRDSLSPTSTTTRSARPTSMADIRHQYRMSAVRMPRNISAAAPKKVLDRTPTVIRHSAEEALVEPAELNHLLMQTSAEYSGSSLSSNTHLRISKNNNFNKDYSDSEDQTSVFTEVQLPNLRENCASKYNKCRESRYQPFPASKPPLCDVGRTSAAAILERLGIRPLKSKRSVEDQSRRIRSLRTDSITVSPTDWSTCSTSVPLSDVPSTDVDKWKLVRKAFIKKRKRKISESDSVASSDASSKQCATIELPDISYTRKLSYPPAVPIVTTVNVETLQKTAQTSKEYTQKMREWENIKLNNISQKGDQTKRSWLKRPKQQRVDSGNGSAKVQSHHSPERYFETDDGRQMTVIEHDDDDDDRRYLASPSSPNTSSKENQWLTPHEADYTFEHSSSEPNLKDGSGRKVTLAVTKEPRRNEIDKRRSVTFCDHSGADTLSIATSQMTVSNDSVFTSHETDLNHLYGGGGADLVQHLVTLQEKNSVLIRTLRDKTEEYEKITDQLSMMENEVKLLRDRYRFDSALENIYSTLIEPNFVPTSMVEELETQIQSLDNNIRTIKAESYQAQQVVMENYAKEQAASRRYLDQIETLQKTNLQLIQRHLADWSPYDPIMRKQFQLSQSYDSLFRFSMNLLRKLKHYRCKLLEKNSSLSKLDLELLQTQSSLLLAHARIERQKIEIKVLQSNQRSLRRTQSYHGQDLLLRLVNNQISFYLPFKLHGSRISNLDHYQSDFSLYDGDDMLETEFARLLESEHSNRGATENYEELELPVRDYKPPVLNRRSIASVEHVTAYNDRPKSYMENQQQTIKLRNNGPSKLVTISPPATKIVQPRPGSCIVPSGVVFASSGTAANYDRYKQTADVGRIIEESAPQKPSDGKTKRPIYATKAPTPLKLGNVGQVRSIAAAFDLPPPFDNPSSAPNTPLAKGAPHLCQTKEQQNINKLCESPTSQAKRQQNQPTVVVMRKTRVAQENPAERMTVSSIKPQSRIPVRMTSAVETQQLGFSHPQLYAQRTSPPVMDRPYETLTFQRNSSAINRRFLQTNDQMNKSSTPEFETTSISTGGSNWSIAKRNEARRRQFFYGEQQNSFIDNESPKTPTPPPPTVSPSPPKSPIPSSPTPLLGKSTSKSSSSKSSSKIKDNSKQVQNNAQETAKKRISWFQKLRHKK